MTRKGCGEWIKQNEGWVFILCLTVLLRIPSLFEPYWYGDEAIYLTLGQAMRKGLTLYSQIHDNKPPFLYLMAALAGGNQFWFKFVTMIWNLVTIVVFRKLAGKFFASQKGGVFISTGLFALATTLPILEGNIANAELFFLLPSIGAILILWEKSLTMRRIWIAGMILGIGGLFKMPVLLEAGIWPLIWLAGREKNWWKKSFILAAGAVTPILLSIAYYFGAGAAKEYLTAAWAQNLPYLSSWKATSNETGIYSIKGRGVVAAVILAIVAGLAKRIGKNGAILGIWWAIGIFAALLSGRPYPHYLIQISGPIALGAVLIWKGQRWEKSVVVLMTLLTAGVIGTFHFYRYPVVSYYANFGKWITGIQSQSQYFSRFNFQVITNYEVAKTVIAGSGKEDRLFIWGDEPMVYALAKRLPIGKYTVAYHIKDLKEEKTTIALLNDNPPKYIVLYLPAAELEGLDILLSKNYILEKEVAGVKIYRRFGLSVRLPGV